MKKLSKKWLLLLLVPVAVLGLYLLWPLPHALQTGTENRSVRILDRTGKLLYEKRQNDFGSRNFLEFEKIPKNIIDAVIAIEDKNFYSHFGINPKSIIRAAWQNYSAKKIVSGGSTITQQLVRSRLKPEKRNYLYKAKEALLAIKLETRLSKEEILEAYLNNVYFGHQAYGIQAASQTFFEKNVAELSRAESAFLVGLIQSPSNYDPYRNFEKAKERQERVIDAFPISEDEKEELKNEPLRLGSGKIDIRAPHFVMWIIDKYGDINDTEIRTTLDLDLQMEIERIAERQLKNLEDKNVSSAAVVVLDAKNGDLLTMVGSADYFDSGHDGAVNVALASRQPGSALKPFTYALALKNGATTATTIADIETQFFTQDGNPYIPRNYDYGYHGLVRYREALANSYNIPAVKVLEKVGVENLLHFLQKAGLTTLTRTPDHYGLALTLGDGEVKLLELTQAYGMLARGGKTLPVRTLLDEKTDDGKRLLDEKIAWLITDILDDDIARLPEFGEGGPLEFDFPVAAKTGTTRNSRDNITIGFTPERVMGVWVGNADNSPMRGTSGITGAGPIFHETMLAAMRNLPKASFKKPDGIIEKEICTLSGKLITDYCPHKMKEWFIQGTEPKSYDDLYTPVAIDTRNSLLAGENCPKEFTEEKIFVIFPPELKTWARENGWPSPPAEFSPLCLPGKEKTGSWLTIEKPNQSETFLLDPLIPDENEKIILSASASDDIEEIDWYIDDQKIGTATRPSFRMEWQPKKGLHEIIAKGVTAEKKISIEIVEIN
ncbi:penicillin-binding protein 1C [Patescibacteria group bacterium]|nr:penicillin-binding protein 1C [Patescibacteria group bacterium]MBU1016087.1 penicillin-binding protein 1C [Patescibacteria group bacterium]MBU1684830.1 penicillin-binding protein 1C [Patescibacteria group bacterium]MBU1938546.1 penicillin-binding protein 1C [Patescibacteria group bacterium]